MEVLAVNPNRGEHRPRRRAAAEPSRQPRLFAE
jgi:hypothetical protein